MSNENAYDPAKAGRGWLAPTLIVAVLSLLVNVYQAFDHHQTAVAAQTAQIDAEKLRAEVGNSKPKRNLSERESPQPSPAI